MAHRVALRRLALAVVELPAGLVARLREVAGASGLSARSLKELDDRVLAAAANHFASDSAQAGQGDEATSDAVIAKIGTPAKGGYFLRLARWNLAAAAGILLAVLLTKGLTTFLAGPPQDQRTQTEGGADKPVAFAEADLNRDGQVNLLDAYLLQRRIEVQASLESAWDLTHDGVVDQRDVQAIAVESVKLPTSSPTRGTSLPTGATISPTVGTSSHVTTERGRL